MIVFRLAPRFPAAGDDQRDSGQVGQGQDLCHPVHCQERRRERGRPAVHAPCGPVIPGAQLVKPWLAGFAGGGRQAVSSWQRVRTAGRPRRMLASGAVIVFRWGCVSRLRASACVLGGAPRPELSTMTPRSVRRVVRGDSEASVSMSGRRTGGLTRWGAVAYFADRNRRSR